VTTNLELLDFISTYPAPPALRADDLYVRWVVPEIFHDIPIQEEDDDRAVQLLGELAEKALPGAPQEEQTKLAVMCALSVDGLSAAGAEYAAICVTAVENVPCTATLFVSLADGPDTDGVRNTVNKILSSLGGVGVGEISLIELPCGPAVSCIGIREEKLVGELTESGEGFAFPTAYIRVYVPLPNGTVVVMEMSTPSMDGWDVFSTMFGNVVSSIRLFNADGSPLITSEVRA
jgi:hypothetical protein